jgi:hypothetical protein
MINAIWEALFCPVHGALRADNLAVLIQMWQQGWLVALQAVEKIRRLV